MKAAPLEPAEACLVEERGFPWGQAHLEPVLPSADSPAWWELWSPTATELYQFLLISCLSPFLLAYVFCPWRGIELAPLFLKLETHVPTPGCPFLSYALGGKGQERAHTYCKQGTVPTP